MEKLIQKHKPLRSSRYLIGKDGAVSLFKVILVGRVNGGEVQGEILSNISGKDGKIQSLNTTNVYKPL